MIVETRTGSSSRAKKPDAPTICIKSNFDLPAFMSDIVIIGNAHFVKFGSIVVERGHERLLEINAGDAALAQRLTIQTLGDRWTQNDELNFYVWTAQGEATITVIVAQSLEPIQPGAVPLPMDVEQLNRLVATEAGTPQSEGQAFLSWLAGHAIEAPPAEWTQLLLTGFGLQNQKALAAALRPRGGIYAEAADRLLALDETLPSPGDETGALFPNKFYLDESHARLVDMGGNKNVIITMSAPQAPKISSLAATPPGASGSSFVDLPGLARGAPPRGVPPAPSPWTGVAVRPRIFDLVLPAGRSALATITGLPSLDLDVPPDFGIRWERQITRYRGPSYWAFVDQPITAGTPTWEAQVDCSDTADFMEPTILVARAPSPGSFSGLNVPKRYLRLCLWFSVAWRIGPAFGSGIYYHGWDRPINWRIADDNLTVTDNNVTGGTGKVSFEVPNALNEWQEFIPPVAIAKGTATSRQFGQANSSYILPSGPRALRARLDVTGALETSVAITLVS